MDKKKQIVVISSVNPKDKSTHSGVVYSITQQLCKRYDIIWIKPRLRFWGIIQHLIPFLWVYFLKLMRYTISHPVVASKVYAYDINRKLKKYKYHAIFGFDSMFLAYIKTDKPIFYRSDAVFHSMIDYYIFNVPKVGVKNGDKVEESVLQKCKYMFVPSQWVVDEVKKWYPSVDINKIKLVHSGANVPFVEFMPERVTDSDCMNLLFIGSNPQRKGIDVAYETVRILNERYNIKATLNCIGGDIMDYKSKPYVNYVGRINKNNKEELDVFVHYLSIADWFIFPTKAECAGIVNCEVSAYGVPIIAYNTGGVSSYVINDINGYCLDSNASSEQFAERIYRTPSEKLKLFSESARRLYETKYNWNVWGKTVFDLIDSSVL